jgi:hypothetical protein
MKAIIENKASRNQEFLGEITNAILDCETRGQIVVVMSKLFSQTDLATAFNFGFGSNHLWVANSDNNKRVIFVEL